MHNILTSMYTHSLYFFRSPIPAAGARMTHNTPTMNIINIIYCTYMLYYAIFIIVIMQLLLL